jgi:hypothetical protein
LALAHIKKKKKKPGSLPLKERTVQPAGAFEDTPIEPGFEIVNSKPACRVPALHDILT